MVRANNHSIQSFITILQHRSRLEIHAAKQVPERWHTKCDRSRAVLDCSPHFQLFVQGLAFVLLIDAEVGAVGAADEDVAQYRRHRGNRADKEDENESVGLAGAEADPAEDEDRDYEYCVFEVRLRDENNSGGHADNV